MENYCRTCFRHNEEFKKFEIDAVSQISDIRISEMLIYCLQVEISPYDRLPQQICDACLSALNSMFVFRKQYYHSDTEFRKLLKYAPPPPQKEPTAPCLELELNLLDATVPDQSAELELEPPEAIDPVYDDHPPLETQEIKIEEECIGKEPPDQQSVEVKKIGAKIFECEQCNHRVSFKGNLVRHQKTRNHSGIRVIEAKDKLRLKTVKTRYSCKECDFQSFVRSNFQLHQRFWKHTHYSTRDVEVDQVLEQYPKCPYCGGLRAKLQQHIAKGCPVLHGKKKKPQKSAKKYASKRSTKEKRTTESEAHQIPTNSVKIETEENIPIPAPTDQEQDESSHCIISQDTQESSIINTTVEGKSTARSVVVKKYLSKVFECEQCNYTAAFKGNLKRHHQSHKHTGMRVTIPTDMGPQKQIRRLQQCLECGYRSFDRLQFLGHQRLCKHTQCRTRDIEVVLEQYPKCPHCGVQRANLEQHIEQWCPKLHGPRNRAMAFPPSRAIQNAATESCSAAPAMEADDVKVEAEEIFDAGL